MLPVVTVPRTLWVKHSSRGSALAFMWFSVLAAGASLVIGFWKPSAWIFLVVIFAGDLWCWLSIRWVDQHDRW
jgi:hypothetical protein